jgi:glycerol-3-phosphate dehydrogenase
VFYFYLHLKIIVDYTQQVNIFCRGSAIAKIIGNNVVNFPERFEEKVSMWVFEELVDGKKLTEIINETHENVKYLPNHKLPSNVVSSMVIEMRIRISLFLCTNRLLFLIF